MSAIQANGYREGMPGGSPSMGGQHHGLYSQAEEIREQSELLARRLHATQRKVSENWQLIQASWDQTERIRARRAAVRTDPDWLRHSPYARLQARLASLPVIEQAKGIIMARHGWPEDRAFDALRRASQQKNIKLRNLAAIIVAQTSRSAAEQEGRQVSTAARPGGDVSSRVSSETSRDRPRARA